MDDRDIRPNPLAESIADRTPVPREGEGSASAGLRLVAEVAESFRVAGALPDEGTDDGLFRWGPLRVRRLIGEGSFGEVYAAWDPALQREVALKLRRNPEDGVGASALRWIDEGRGLARVRHPNVLTVFGASLYGGRAGIWTERVVGRTLEAQLVACGPLPPLGAARVGRDLCAALAAVHEAGLVHGDVKTANVMLERSEGVDDDAIAGRVVLMDFGTASARATDETPLPGVAAGTPLAMAPELLDGGPPTPVADVYSAGVVLFRLLTGRYPIEATTLAELRAHHRERRRRPLREACPSCPARIAAIVERALDPNPLARFASARAMSAALDQALDPWRAWRKRLLLATGVASIVLAATVALLAWRERGREQPVQTLAPPVPARPGLLAPAWSVAGDRPETQLGTVVCRAGDVNGDGFQDVAIGEPRWSGERYAQGRVRVFAGGPRGLASAPMWTFVGRSQQGRLANRMAPAGDVDGDGYDDFLVQERQFFDPARPDAVGAVYLFRGSRGGLSPVPDLVLHSDESRVGFGDGMASAGDVNGDGYADVLIGESQRRNRFENEGVVMLFLGGPHGLSSRPVWETFGGQAGVNWGWQLSPTGDVNGDGHPDLLLGAAHWSTRRPDVGRACLYLGGPHGLANEPVWTRTGERENGEFGRVLGFVGDLDGDGCDEFAVASPFYSSGGLSSRGRLDVFLGNRGTLSHEPWRTFLGSSTDATLGQALMPPVDVDGDRRSDLGFSASSWTKRRGAQASGLVLVYSGASLDRVRAPTWICAPDTAQWFAGSALEGADVDADGVAELLVGMPGARGVNGGDGRVVLYGLASHRRIVVRPQP